MAAPSGAPAPTRRSRACSASRSIRASPCTRPSRTSTLAPRNAAGRVECWADFYLLRPVDPARRESPPPPRRAEPRPEDRARHVQRHACACPIRARAEDFGNGFLMRHGYTVAWVGWQPDVPRRDGLMALSVPRPPTARGRSRVACAASSGRTRAVDVAPARGSLPHSASRRPPRRSGRRADRPRARRRAGRGRPAASLALRAPRRRPPSSRITATCTSRRASSPGKIYDCYYRAEDPPLVGLGFTAVRDTGGLPALRRRGGGQPVRRVARPRLRLRRVAERALPPPSALPRAQRGRARAARLRRGDPSRGGGAARGVQLPLRAAVAQCRRVARQPLSVHRRRAERSRDRPARRRCSIALRARAVACRRSSPINTRRSTGAATPRSSTPTSTGRATSSRRRRCAPISWRGRSTRPARCRRLAATPIRAAAGRHVVQHGRLRAAPARGCS